MSKRDSQYDNSDTIPLIYIKGINVWYVSEPYKESCVPNPGRGSVTSLFV